MNIPTLETRAEEAADMDMSRERYMRRVEREPAMAIALEMTIGLVVAVLAGVAIVLLGGSETSLDLSRVLSGPRLRAFAGPVTR
jgi:hypothetical protein